MLRRLVCVLSALFVCSAVPSVRGDAPPTEETDTDVATGPLTVSRAVEEALARSPALLEARERLNEIGALELQARSLGLPQVTAEASTSRDRDPGFLNSPNFDRLAETPGFDDAFLQPIPVTTYDYRVQLEQIIYAFGKVGAGVEALRIERLAADASAAGRALDVARDAALACYDTALADAQLDVLAAEKRSRERQVDQARDFLEIGAGTRLQLLQAEAGLASVEPRILAAEGERRESRARLNRLLGRDPLAPIAVDPAILSAANLAELPTERDLVERVESRPEILALDLAARSLEMQIRVVKADRLPTIRFSGSYGFRAIDAANLTDTDFASWSAGVFLSVPLYDSRDRAGQAGELASRRKQTALRREDTYGQLAEQLVSNLAKYRSASEAASAAALAEERAAEAQRVAGEEYRFGAATLLDTLEAERTLTEARLQKLEAIRDALAALARVKTLTGEWPGLENGNGGGT